MSNQLKNEGSPYLLQHSDNPVNWYPWCDEAFKIARDLDKPIFLSIGYSTCHWCHVMGRESFQDEQVAELLNKYFVSIKVDKEERPDIDNVYMSVCQAMTGSGGWPLSVFITADKKPFFAGTYFPKNSQRGVGGFIDLLKLIAEKWSTDRQSILISSDEITAFMKQPMGGGTEAVDKDLINLATDFLKRNYDPKYGGFGDAPKFPSPHNLLFFMKVYRDSGDEALLSMCENTLMQMYRGGLYDHIGYGFSRYSTDRMFLVPHFEKMLYDNALLIMAYSEAYTITDNPIYREIAENTADYVLRELTDESGGFYCAQDADSDGVEGKYYVFTPSEITDLLGDNDGMAFNRCYGITRKGNFFGNSIPNLLPDKNADTSLKRIIPKVYEYRKQRTKLCTDEKMLTAWNGLMIHALCKLYRVTRNKRYIDAAKKADHCIEKQILNDTLPAVIYKDGKQGKSGYFNDYAYYVFGLLALHDAVGDKRYLTKAMHMCVKAIANFFDDVNGGFFMSGTDNEKLIFTFKDTYDGAMPSGNSIMTYNLVRLNYTASVDELIKECLRKQVGYMCSAAKSYPAGHTMFLIALTEYLDMPKKITIVLNNQDLPGEVPFIIHDNEILSILEKPTAEYPLLNNKTTYYICTNHCCMPPVNELTEHLH